MIGAARESQLAAVRRARFVRRLAPVAALAAAGTSYGLHHMAPFEGHELGVILLILAAAGVVALIPVALARAAERQLPVVVTLRPGDGDIRAVTPDDLDFCATLHAETLPHGFFAELGHRFLRAYLATFVASPHAVALLRTAQDTPVGMVVGMLRPPAHARWVLRHRGLRLAFLGGMALAVRPRLALRFARTRIARYRRAWGRRSAAPSPDPAGQPAVLSHVAVAPGAQGAGLGAQLVDAFVDAARAAGSQRVVLVTLAGESGAAGFYRRRGWVESGRRGSSDGEPLIEFTLPLHPEEE